MRKCPLCGKTFVTSKIKNTTYLAELGITGMCPECYERTFNDPVVSVWGARIGYCYNCDRPFYKKDTDKGPRCTCGSLYEVSAMKMPETKEEWLEAFNKAVDACPKLYEKLPELVDAIREHVTERCVTMLQVTLVCTPPFPVDEEVEGLELVERLLDFYVNSTITRDWS